MSAPRPRSRLKTVATRGGAVVVIGAAGAIGLLAKWEDGKLPNGPSKVYADKLANNLPTACFGITKYVSPVPVIVGDVWSEEKCWSIAALTVEKGQLQLADCLTTPTLPQHTFDALTSFGHNVGMGNVCASRAVGLINAGKLAEGCHSIAYRPDGTANWSYVGTKFVQGLWNRRKDEAKICAGEGVTQ